MSRREALRPARALALALALALTAAGTPSRAQDFSSAAAPGPAPSPVAFLEHGLPPASCTPAAEATLTSWHQVPGLTTRAAGLGAGWRTLRAAAGLSQSGDPEIGWSALGFAVGAACPSWGAAVRGVLRRDRAPGTVGSALGPGVGAEAGAAAWVEAARGVTAWAAAPQLWTRGVAPPLPRPLAIGARVEGGGLGAWLEREAAGASAPGRLAAGLGLVAGPLSIRVGARDHPLGGVLGFAARASGFTVSAEVESHPVLAETLRIGIAVGAAR
ncbi:MAG: hypothetical protein A2W00_03255 [Candidatus Eisenbacteria bacterium RBG_16_71_46]|nr:MAG: hypothetical protein A2W00_03255 [Candidatus Eisenbacteria bacterium RBG_16_71_46]